MASVVTLSDLSTRCRVVQPTRRPFKNRRASCRRETGRPPEELRRCPCELSGLCIGTTRSNRPPLICVAVAASSTATTACVVYPFGEKKPLCKDLCARDDRRRASSNAPAGRRWRRDGSSRRAKDFAARLVDRSPSAPMPEPEVPERSWTRPPPKPRTTSRKRRPEFEYVPAGHAESVAEEPADHTPPPPPAQPADRTWRRPSTGTSPFG